MTDLKPLRAPGAPGKFFTASLAWPLLLLMAFAGLHEWELRAGRAFSFPVQERAGRAAALSKAFLFGWHLEYRVDYGLSAPAQASFSAGGAPGALKVAAWPGANRAVFLCLSPPAEGERRLSRKAEDCPSGFVKGRLVPPSGKAGAPLEFQAKNLNRFYLSEKQAKFAGRLFSQAEKKEILVSVTKRGAASLRDILLDGRSLKSLLASGGP